MDKSRQQFEEEFKRRYPIPLTDSDVFIKEIAFKFWQASRESLEIELPEPNSDDSGSPNFFDGYNTAISDVHDELISNGVKIKND